VALSSWQTQSNEVVDLQAVNGDVTFCCMSQCTQHQLDSCYLWGHKGFGILGDVSYSGHRVLPIDGWMCCVSYESCRCSAPLSSISTCSVLCSRPSCSQPGWFMLKESCIVCITQKHAQILERRADCVLPHCSMFGKCQAACGVAGPCTGHMVQPLQCQAACGPSLGCA
jgi:hypothetical protein